MGGKCALPGTEHAVFKAVPARTRGACAAEAQARGAAAPAVSEAACVLLAERFAFLGNSLLRPMGSGTACGLNEGFWEAFAAGLGRAGFLGAARSALGRLAAHARREADAATADEAVLRIAQEHARLFVGPPKPAAPPWETMYAQPGRIGAVGFGRATFAMQDLLRAAGLRMAGESNQYADHLGIELLLRRHASGPWPGRVDRRRTLRVRAPCLDARLRFRRLRSRPGRLLPRRGRTCLRPVRAPRIRCLTVRRAGGPGAAGASLLPRGAPSSHGAEAPASRDPLAVQGLPRPSTPPSKVFVRALSAPAFSGCPLPVRVPNVGKLRAGARTN